MRTQSASADAKRGQKSDKFLSFPRANPLHSDFFKSPAVYIFANYDLNELETDYLSRCENDGILKCCVT